MLPVTSQTTPLLPGALFLASIPAPYLNAVSQGAFPLGTENTVMPGEEGHEHNKERGGGGGEIGKDMKSKKRTGGTAERQNCEPHHVEKKRGK